MTENGLISIIVPIYNIEKYLEECLQSLVQQTYKNIEIICVDDGSTDNSGEICKQFADSDERVIVISQKNKGAGAARNTALRMARGEYIGFVDSDDYVSKDMYQKLYDAIIKNDCDIASCNFCNVFKNRIDAVEAKDNKSIYSNTEILKLTAVHWKYYIVCNKLFKRELIDGIEFPEGNSIDDGFFTYQVFAKAKKIVWIEDVLYYYRQRKSSVMNEESRQRKRALEASNLHKEKLEFAKKSFKSLLSVFQKKLIDTCIINIRNGYLTSEEVRDCICYLRKNCFKALLCEYSFKESLSIIRFLFFSKRKTKASVSTVLLNSELIDEEYFE
ncbi:MAG: glycosyltransferase [Ruminococcus sp.]|nr:glycosyltransferase [Ruminococcus sp.]